MMNPNMFGSNNITEFNNILLDSYDLHFPDPFLDDDLFCSRFSSSQQPLFTGGDFRDEQDEDHHNQTKQNSDHHKATTTTTTKNKKNKMKCSSRKIGSSTKRIGKKDRHSKIYTAQGPRDRRMRLSLQIATKFFNLQDMLGFDKASKTIDWLLSNSTTAITDLKQSFNNNNNNNNNCRSYSYGSVCSGSSEVINNAGGGSKEGRQLRVVAKESRDKARARARLRTMLKKTHDQHQDQNFCFNFKHVSSELQDQDTHHKVLPISHGLSDFPSIHGFFSGINNYDTLLENHDYSSLISCPNSILMDSPIPKPYSFSDDSTILSKLP